MEQELEQQEEEETRNFQVENATSLTHIPNKESQSLQQQHRNGTFSTPRLN